MIGCVASAHTAPPTASPPIAVIAITRQHASLLQVGVTHVEGAFEEGDPIEIIGPDDGVFAREFAGHGSHELLDALSNGAADGALGMHGPVVHRALLILL